ncbi:MAG: OmpH family outer membrane protein [Puniceicoccales bacterium]|nr:OmpH family outer membrane protein [Puniceicoccales bacterium]
MKKLLFALCLATFAFCGTAQAQKTPRVATVDMEAVFKQYQKAVEVTKALEDDAQRARQAETGKYQALEALAAEIEKARRDAASPVLSEQGKTNARTLAEGKIREFEQRRTEFTRAKQESDNILQQRSMNNTRTIVGEIRPVVDALAKEKGVDLVLSSTYTVAGVLFAAPELDLTNEVVKRLNAAYAASIAVPALPSAPAATSGATPATLPPRR